MQHEAILGERMANLPRPSACGTLHINAQGGRAHSMSYDWVLRVPRTWPCSRWRRNRSFTTSISTEVRHTNSGLSAPSVSTAGSLRSFVRGNGSTSTLTEREHTVIHGIGAVTFSSTGCTVRNSDGTLLPHQTRWFRARWRSAFVRRRLP